MPPKVVANPYAKKRKAAGGSSSSSSVGASAIAGKKRSPVRDGASGTGKSATGATAAASGSFRRRGDDVVVDERLLPSNRSVVVPATFSQAFTSIDETDGFRRVSESFETEIRGNDKRESFRLARKGRRKKEKTGIFERAARKAAAASNDDDDRRGVSPSASNRDGGRTGKRPAAAATADGEGGPSATRRREPADRSGAAATGGDEEDVRIHHTMLQPHVLYVSTRQKGNRVLELVRNVPIAYSPMVPDYIFGATSCALFLSIKYHKLYPRYIHRRIAELRGDFRFRVLLVLVDMDDNANAILQLNTIGVTQRLAVILCWSELEAARYLETYKVRDGKDAAPIQKRESVDPLERVADFLTGGRRAGNSVNKTDAVSLWSQFSTIAGVAAATRDELALVGGMGPVKVRRLHEALNRPFSKLRARERARKRREQQERDRTEDDDPKEAPAEEEDPRPASSPAAADGNEKTS